MNQAIGFFTHVWNDKVAARYHRLCQEQPASVFIVAETGTPVPARLRELTCYYDYAQLAQHAPGAIGSTIVPGNCHLAMLEFARRHPGYDHYWQVEYDVVFTGSWSIFFEAWAPHEADLLATHLCSRPQEPNWHWWIDLDIPGADLNHHTRAFLPIYRISSAALAALETATRAGATGHFEALIPTLLHCQNFELADLGQSRYYVSSHSAAGELFAGTMRFRPPHAGKLRLRNVLYHPVKPEKHGPTWRYFLHWPLWNIKEPKAAWRSHLATLRLALSRGFTRSYH